MEDIIEEVPRNQRYNHIFIKEDGKNVYINVKIPSVNFKEITSKRVETDPLEIKKNISSSGHDLACMGVSTILTTTIDNNDYLIFVNSGKMHNNKLILSFVSGYIEEANIFNPEKAIDIEIAEELLLFTNEDKLIRFIRENKELPKTFSKVYSDSFIYAEITSGDKFDLHLPTSEIYLEGREIKYSPKILYESFVNTALIIYNNHLNLTKETFQLLKNIYHTENLSGGETLRTRLYPEGVFLAKLINKKLNGEIYKFKERELIKLDPKSFCLFHGFTCGNNIFKSERCIDFLEYVLQQK